MYLRKIRRMKDGKLHIYWALVESVRCGRKIRQRVVSYLGDLEQEEVCAHGELAWRTSRRDSSQPDLLESLPGSERAVEVLPSQIGVGNDRVFGDAWVGLWLWRFLGFDKFLEEHLKKGRESVRWGAMTAYQAIARLCAPSSDLRIAEHFTDQSALADLLGIHPGRINDDRLYRTLDRVVRHKGCLERHLRERYSALLHVEFDLLLYDLTSTYFEGEGSENRKAKRGYSRDGRSDAVQVVIALVVTREGLPLSCEVFDGNRHDCTTLKAIVRLMERRHGRAQRVWVMDRGIASEENLTWLRERGCLYLVGTPKPSLRRFEQQMLSASWREVREGLNSALVKGPDGSDEVYVLCRSDSRREKELAMLARFADRLEKGLVRVQQACRRKKAPLRNLFVLGQRLGVLKRDNSRAAQLFDILVSESPNGLDVTWTRRDLEGSSWAERSAGHYVLRSNISGELAPEEMWKAYIGLTQVEAAFRCYKTDLEIRPVFHRTACRVKAHIFVCFLALVLHKVLELQLEQRGLGRSPDKVLAELRGWRAMDLTIPTTSGAVLHRRVVSDPDPPLRILLGRMAIPIPKTLPKDQNVVETSASGQA